MSDTIVITLGQLVGNQTKKSVQAFNTLGLSSFWMVFRYLKLMPIINQYKLGKISTDDFRTQINALFNTHFKEEPFKEAWNAMCTLSDNSINKFRDIMALIKQGKHIQIVSSTNPMHWEHIKSQLVKHNFSQEDLETLEKHLILSYEHGKLGNNLIDFAIQKHQSQSTKTYMMLTPPPGITWPEISKPWTFFTCIFTNLLNWNARSNHQAILKNLAKHNATHLDWYFSGSKQEQLSDALIRQNKLSSTTNPTESPEPPKTTSSEVDKEPILHQRKMQLSSETQTTDPVNTNTSSEPNKKLKNK